MSLEANELSRRTSLPLNHRKQLARPRHWRWGFQSSFSWKPDPAFNGKRSQIYCENPAIIMPQKHRPCRKGFLDTQRSVPVSATSGAFFRDAKLLFSQREVRRSCNASGDRELAKPWKSGGKPKKNPSSIGFARVIAHNRSSFGLLMVIRVLRF